MVDFKKLEEDVVGGAEKALREVVHEAEANEPTIGAAVRTALDAAGVPAGLSTTIVGVVEGILAHFQTEHATTPVEAAPAKPAEPPTAEPAPAEASTAPVAPEPAAAEEAATADPFAPAATAPPAG